MNIFKQIISFVVLVLLQVFIFNNILFHAYLNPYVYIIFILFFPFNVDRGLVMVLAFLLGLSIDIFENSGGVHIAATVLLAYTRNLLLRLSTRRRGADLQDTHIGKLPFGKKASYLLMAIFLHHLALFLIESFSFSDLGTILVRTVVSGAFTFFFVMLLQLWNLRK